MPDRTLSATPDPADREFEIILGNKQLFSLMFVVFVLLGVFFAMGYVMGRSTLPVDAAGRRTTPASAAEERVFGDKPAAASSRQKVEEPAPVPSAESTPSVATTKPDSPAAPDPAPESRVRKPVVEDPPSSALMLVEPRPGQTWLQVSAVGRPEAELLVDVLVKKGFRAVIAPGPSEKLFRVLVGPARDDAEVVRTRTELEQSGFRPIPRRY